jgi:hypothetical protein
MSRISASVTLKSNKKEVLQAAQESIDRGLMACGMEAVTLTHRDKDNNGTPVDTGRLRNSIAWAVADKSGGGGDGTGGESDPMATPQKSTLVIGTNVEYAKYIEEGTYNRKAYHMLRNALADGADRYEKIIKANLEAANVE